jgi:hypothetical protein
MTGQPLSSTVDNHIDQIKIESEIVQGMNEVQLKNKETAFRLERRRLAHSRQVKRLCRQHRAARLVSPWNLPTDSYEATPRHLRRSRIK